jgi:hypothetical protein
MPGAQSLLALTTSLVKVNKLLTAAGQVFTIG